MADRFVIAAGGNFSAPGTWSATDGGAGGAGVPTAADNACMSNLSGNLVIDAASVCLDFDQTRGTGYAGTLSGSATLAVSGSMKRKGTWTYSGAITFAATATGKTIQNNGVAYAGNSLTFSGSGGGWTFADATTGAGNISHSAGTANYAGFSVNCGAWTMNQATASVTLGAATMNLAGFWLVSNGTLSAASSSIIITGNFNFTGGGNAYGSLTATSGQQSNQITGANSFVNLTLLNGANKNQGWTINATQTVSGTLTLTGNSAINRLFFGSDAAGTQRTINITGATAPVLSHVDFMDINAAGGLSWAAQPGTTLGDCGGNSGITTTTPATQTATGTASFTWSTHGWTSRVPLPQDDVVVNNAFIAGRTVTMDMPRAGKTIDFSGCTGSPAVNCTITCAFFGSWKNSASMTRGTGAVIQASGRGSFTVQTNGVWGTNRFNVNAPGGTYTLLDSLNTVTENINVNSGTLNDGGFSVSCFNASVPTASGTLTKSGNWTLAGLTWTAVGTINDSAGWIKFTDASASTKTFAGGGKTYNQVWISGAGTGAYQFSGNNTITTFTIDTPPHTVQFTAGSTTNITNWQGNGTPGNLNVIDSITAASHTLNFTQNPGHVDGDYLNIAHSTATPANWWFAGSHSTNSGNNSGWVFADYVGMVANANVIASVTPQLTTSIILQASESVQTAWSGSLGTGIICRTAMQASASITAPLTTAIPMAASLLDVATLAANLVGNNCEDFEVPTSPHVFAVPDQPHVFKA